MASLDLSFPPEGRLFHDLVQALEGVDEAEFLAACEDPFLLEFPFTRPTEGEPEAAPEERKSTQRLGVPQMDGTMELSLEAVLAYARGRKQAEGARIHRLTPKAAGGPIVVGRSPSCDLVLPEPTVSSKHAQLHCRDGRWGVIDMGSQNGTYIDGTPIKADALVLFQTDQTLWFASYRTVFLSPSKTFEMVSRFGQFA